jgi:hypothetical protein
MNSKRRAELQRKLSMGPVARPPADLLDRIKADIPTHLRPQAERSAFGRSWSFPLRIAATLILLVTTGIVTFRLVQPAPMERTAAVSNAKLERPVPAITRSLTGSSTPPPAAEEEVRLEITQAVPDSVPLPAMQPQRMRADAAATEAKAPENEAGYVADAIQETTIVTPAAPADVANAALPERAEKITVTAEAPMLAAPPPPPSAAMAPAVPPPAAAPAPASAPVAAPAARTGLVSELFAYSLPLEQKKTVFGISIDPESFPSIKKELESGGRPTPNRIDVDALVNYFAGAPAKAPRRPVNLEVEASPAPIRTTGQRAILRFTIDTARVAVAQRASTPPIATEAKIEIDFNQNVVASYRRVGNEATMSAEPILLHNVSVTGLYEVELKPNLKAKQRVATVKLRYRDLTTGREQTLTRIVHGHDLAKEWARASRRHRLASLGAVWSENLKGAAPDGDVARRAEELAAQNPGDARARDLAEAASATTGGGM